MPVAVAFRPSTARRTWCPGKQFLRLRSASSPCYPTDGRTVKALFCRVAAYSPKLSLLCLLLAIGSRSCSIVVDGFAFVFRGRAESGA